VANGEWSRRLSGCTGYQVRDANGRGLGIVAWMRYESRPDRPDALAAQPRFLGGRRMTLVPVERVTEVNRDNRLVILSTRRDPPPD
jgi:hypothetical protein